MEEARKKLRICLIFVVALAVMAGCIYYFNDVKKKENINGGTLVMSQTGSRGDGYGIIPRTGNRGAEYGIEQ